MRCLIIGLGVQGKKRLAHAQDEAVATVDLVDPSATYRHVGDVPADSYEAALVCTPDQVKWQILPYLLERGKHVLVEKPMLGTQAELTRLRCLVQHHKVACYTAYNHRFEPQIQRLKTILDRQELGDLYLLRFCYGNGTAQDVRRSLWRDQGMGVRADLGSHLLDLTLFLLGPRSDSFTFCGEEHFETRAPDYCSFASPRRPRLEFVVSLVSWRNTFTIDVIGARGSAHVNGLCKWGPSTLTVRQRVFPSGRPFEESWSVDTPDPTWAAEYTHFKDLCRTGGSNIDNDIWISSVLHNLTPVTSPGMIA